VIAFSSWKGRAPRACRRDRALLRPPGRAPSSRCASRSCGPRSLARGAGATDRMVRDGCLFGRPPAGSFAEEGGSRGRPAPSRPPPPPSVSGVPHAGSAATSCVVTRLRQRDTGPAAPVRSKRQRRPGVAWAAPGSSRACCRRVRTRGPGAPARTAPGAMDRTGTLPPILVSVERNGPRCRAAHASSSLAGRWSRPGMCSDPPGTMEIGQENNAFDRL